MLHPLALSFVILAGCVGLDLAPEPASDPRRSLPTPGRPATPAGPDAETPDDTGADPGDPGADPGDPGDPDGDPDEGPDTSENPLAGLTLWIDPDSPAAREAADASGAEADLFGKIATQPVAKWLGGWSGDVASTVRDAVDAADADGAVRVFVVYNLPNRDCGGYSSGGASDADAYRAWVADIADGLDGRAAVLILEPDGLSMMDCLSSSDADTRYTLLADAVSTLRAAGGIVYLDGGHSAWHPVGTMAERLRAADIAGADGFALNTSNFETTDDIVAYGEAVSAETDGAHFVVDTARNGLGPTSDHAWCNPDGRALGLPPSVATGNPLVDGLLWVKTPGESDGTCNGGPSAGEWWPEYALGLAERAAW